MPPELPEPWRSFLREDVLVVLPPAAQADLVARAGRGSPLHEKHGVYLDVVTVATFPEDYETRLTEMFPGTCDHIRFFALDPYDLALAKLELHIDHVGDLCQDTFVRLEANAPLRNVSESQSLASQRVAHHASWYHCDTSGLRSRDG
jgi:hypothetical protein